MKKFALAFALFFAASCSGVFAGAPTIAVLTDGFGTGVGSAARANTPTGATTGSYGPPNSDWGVGNGWVDVKGSTGAVPGTGFNIAGGYASSTYAGTDFLEQDAFYTPGPNQAIQATFVSPTNTSTPTYGVAVRGEPNTDAYSCYFANNSDGIIRFSGGNATVAQLSGGTVSGSPTITAGHNLAIKLTATGDGSTTTSLSCTLTDTTTSTVLSTLSGTDTTTELQSGGRVGILSALNSGTVLNVSQAIVYSDTPLTGQIVYLGFGPGDSLTYGLSSTLQNAPDVICRMLNVIQTAYHYVPVNMGFSGATTAMWVNGASQGYLAATIQNYNALGVQYYFTTLGGNDANQLVPAATWLSNYNASIAYLNSHTSVVRGIFNEMSYVDAVRYNSFYGGVNPNLMTLLRTYPYTSLTGVTLGDTTLNSTFQNVDYFGLYDGGHPADQAIPLLAFAWIMQFMKATKQIGPNPSFSFTLGS